MAFNTPNKQYTDNAPLWEKLNDCYHGPERIKSKEYTYLPATPSQTMQGLRQGQPGRQSYLNMIARAVFPELVYQTIESALGIMHQKPPNIRLPRELEYLRNRATGEGESLNALLRTINFNQLLYGRAGLVPTLWFEEGATQGIPLISHYSAPSIINWSHDFVILRTVESQYENFTESQTNVYWIFAIQEGILHFARRTDRDITSTDELGQYIFRNNTFNFLPFTFINANDTVSDVDRAPLLPLANMSLQIYLDEADYRNTKFATGQPTLVITGSSGAEKKKATPLGPGAKIELPKEATAQFLEVSGDSLAELRTSLENDYRRADEQGASLLTTRGKEAESGDALRIRVNAKAATRKTIALAGGDGLEEQLRHIGRMWQVSEERLDNELEVEVHRILISQIPVDR